MNKSNNNLNKLNAFLNKLSARQKLLICGIIALSIFIVLYLLKSGSRIRIMITWDSFCLLMLFFSWITFFYTKHSQIRLQAKRQDESRSTIFLVVLVLIIASLLGILLLLNAEEKWSMAKNLRYAVALTGIPLSWFLLHTIFTLRYAHLFYGDKPSNPDEHSRGLEFPQEEKPDYMDFAYLSFVIGMTFQVSDVQVTSKKLRRLILLHGLISFAYNTIIIALSISIVAGFKSDV